MYIEPEVLTQSSTSNSGSYLCVVKCEHANRMSFVIIYSDNLKNHERHRFTFLEDFYWNCF